MKNRGLLYDTLLKIFHEVATNLLTCILGSNLGHIALYHDLDKVFERSGVGIPVELGLSLGRIAPAIWNKTTKQNISGTAYFPIYSDTTFHKGKSIAIVDRTPKKTPKQIRQTYAKSIDVAKSNIQIVNPYFLPTRSIRNPSL